MRRTARRTISLIATVALALLAMPVLTACDNGDDIKEIFTGKVWKLSYIYAEGAYSIPIDFWDGDAAKEEASRTLRDVEGNYTVEFSGAEMDGVFKGAVNGRIVNSTFSGQWQADAATHALTISNLTFGGNAETDVQAVNFKRGLQNVYRYTGDSNGLYLHYKENTMERVLALFVSKTK